MFEIIIATITVSAAMVTILVGLRTFRRGPHIGFALDKTELFFDNPKDTQNVTLLIAYISNKKRRFLGDTAKKLSGRVLYRTPSKDNWPGLNATACLPWLRPSLAHVRINEKLRLDKDFQRVFETQLFERTEKDIPQGRGEVLAVAYGIEKTNKLFFASSPPIEVPLPTSVKHKEVLTHCSLRLEVAGENLSSKCSEGTVIVAKNWKEWSYLVTVSTLHTPSRIRNLLLRIGIGRKVKVISSKKP